MKRILPVLFLLSVHTAAQAKIVFVDASATGAANGSSWTNAYTTLSAALAASAATTTPDSLFIAAGTYYPTGAQNSTDRDSSFCIFRGGIKLYGGYPAGGGPRNPVLNEVFLNGNIGAGTATDNSYHVVVIAGLSTTTDSVVLDGVSITGGRAVGRTQVKTFNGVAIPRRFGGGLCIAGCGSAPIAARGCILKNNSATGDNATSGNPAATAAAGALYVKGCAVSVSNTSISANSVKGGNGLGVFTSFLPSMKGYGGGVYLDAAQCTFFGCILADNMADGGRRNTSPSDPIPTYDYTEAHGSGVYATNSSASFVNCGFIDNTVYGYGGGVYADASAVNLTHCTFYGNAAYSHSILSTGGLGPTQGAAMWATPGAASNARNSIFRNNEGPGYNMLNSPISGPVSLAASIYQGSIGGAGNLGAEPLFVSVANRDFHLRPCSPGVDAGDNAFAASIPTDADGTPRIHNGTADMGMFEYSGAPGVPPVVGPISGPPALCRGVSVAQFTNGTPGGVWSRSGLSPIVINATTGVATINNTGLNHSGQIRYMVTDTNGCAATVTLPVTIVRQTGLAVSPLSGTSGLTFVNDTPWAPQNVRWIRCDAGNIVVGSGANYFPTIPGSYAVVAEFLGCSDTSACHTSTTTAIAGEAAVGAFRIYPNPAVDLVRVAATEALRAVVTTPDGRVVLRADDAREFSVGSLPVGVYVVSLFREDGVVVLRERLVRAAR